MKRFYELDLLRGVAIVMMVAFHFVFDLHNFFGVNAISTDSFFWTLEGRIAAILFIGLTGVLSVILSKEIDFKTILKKNTTRGLRLIAFAMLITLATYGFDSANTVWFGILHFLGVAIVFSTFFLRFRWANLIFGIVMIAAGEFPSPTFQSFDYYPPLPWFGVVLLGVWLGTLVYPKNRPLVGSLTSAPGRALAWIGKHSLAIYLIHQPILIAVLMLIFRQLPRLN